MSYRSSPFRKRACYKHTKQALNFGPFPRLWEQLEASVDPGNVELQAVNTIGAALHHYMKMTPDAKAMAFIEFIRDKSLLPVAPAPEPQETGSLRFLDYLQA